jgi:NAD(P)H dehydrogenase (quinone)
MFDGKCQGEVDLVDDVNVLVVFYSRTGSTERLAVWIAEGAIQAGAKIRLRRARDLMPADVISQFPEWAENGERMDKEYAAPRVPDAQWADAIIVGTPDRHVVISTELRAYLDLLAVSDPERRFERKVGSVFSSSYDQVLGRPAVLDAEKTLLELGLLVAPGSRVNMDAGGETGYDLAHAHGRKVTEIARALRLGGRDTGQ